MYSGLSVEQENALRSRLACYPGLTLKNLVCLFDYDLTMAKKKNPKDFDDAPLERGQHGFFADFSRKVGGVIVQTARGEASTEDYLKQSDHVEEFGSLENVFLASNSGHLWRGNIAENVESTFITIPGYEDDAEKLDQVIDGIHSVLDDIKAMTDARPELYPLLKVDKREKCGAVIFQIDGEEESALVKSFFEQTNTLIAQLPKDIAACVTQASKKTPVMLADGRVQTQGYIDFKPQGMDKGYTTRKILTEFYPLDRKDVLIVAGDSNSDYPMMKIANELVKQGKIRGAICIDVGGQIDDKHHVIDFVLDPDGVDKKERQHDAIDRFYGLLSATRDILPYPVRKDPNYQYRISYVPRA
ncbi:MAG: HAD hydrolase family protein [Alphaproteobacteria bacterium]|nr:HAD hydrolase family protein [Alphaproteobacteria bacterium]